MHFPVHGPSRGRPWPRGSSEKSNFSELPLVEKREVKSNCHKQDTGDPCRSTSKPKGRMLPFNTNIHLALIYPHNPNNGDENPP